MQLPWQYKIVVAVGLVFILFTLIYIPKQLLSAGLKPPTVEPLRITSVYPAAGIFDPALADNPKTSAVWMAYAAEEKSQKDPSGKLPNVRLAGSKGGDGKCKNWSQIRGGFEAKPDELLAPDGQTVFRSGAWRVETPALVYDPDDPGREWKLYAYRYFWAPNPAEQTLGIAQHYGMIVYKYASDPAKEWSAEQWLFSPAPDYPPPPYEQVVLLHLNQLDPSLQDVVAYSRPSVIYKDGALVMTLSAFTGGGTPDRTIMIISRDHGNSWLYAGSPLRQSDLAGIGDYTKLAGASLIEDKGRIFLAAVLGDKTQTGRGTFIFGFDDVARGLLHRDSKTGAPVILRQLPLNSKVMGAIGGGFAAYTEACPFGLLTAEQTPGAASFQIFKTYKLPVAK
ncbi:MAG: glycoside hydrolase [Alphaproteobacteria bacterium]|nr:glycoside hydrolase [Alphaproteobacteria bacterium]